MSEFHDEIDPYEYTDENDMFSGWTDHEIAEYEKWLADENKFADMPEYPGDIEISDPPF